MVVKCSYVPSAVSFRSQRMMALMLLLTNASDHWASVSSMIALRPQGPHRDKGVHMVGSYLWFILAKETNILRTVCYRCNVKFLGYLVKYHVHLSLENLSDMFP